MSNAFKSARRKLIFIYLLIIAVVILLFSTLVLIQVDQRDADSKLSSQSDIVLSTSEAREYAKAEKPNSEVSKTEYEIKNGKLLYEVSFNDGESVYVDITTGTLDQRTDNDSPDTLYYLLTDDIHEIVFWLGLIVFLLASAGSLIVANATLKPISVSAQRQKRFVSDAAHELRNPLAALLTTLELYVRSDTKKQFNETVAQELLSEVKRLIYTSESLLSFEKIETAKDLRACIVSNHIDNVSKRLQGQLETKNLTIKKNLVPAPISIDPNDLETIFYNLLHNAIKFSNSGDTITVTWDGVEFTISDTGKGIDAKHIPHIFERFYKAAQARTLDTEHSNGLGLALVQEIVTSYKGKISVVSELGKGTTFTITF
jgi:signal transduction histidine kinase